MQISLRICTVYSNKRFFVSYFNRSACNNGSYVKKRDMSVRVVSKCSLLQHDVAHFCALGRIIGQTEVVLISKNQKDRTLCVRLCVLLKETCEFKAGRVRRIAWERTNLPDIYEKTTYSVVVNE